MLDNLIFSLNATTLFSAITLTFWLFLARTLGWI